MDDAQIRKLLDADLVNRAARAANPRATLTALGQKIEAALTEVDRQLTDTDLRAMELPGQLDAELQKLGKLDAVIAKARQDGRADLEQAAVGRKASLAARIAELEAEGGKVDARATTLQELRELLEARQVELASAIAAAPPDARPATPASPPAGLRLTPVTPPAVAAASQPPSPKATPATAPVSPTPKPAAGGAPATSGKKDALEDAFAALLAETNTTLDEVKLPPRKNAPQALAASDDLGIPDLVTVSADELPDDATDEDRAPLPTVPQRAANRANPPKGATPSPAKPASAPAKAASAPAKAAPAASNPIANVPKPAAPTPAKAPAKADAAPEAPARSRAMLWTTLLVVVGSTGAAYAHFVLKLF
jgi:hypothetical protein